MEKNLSQTNIPQQPLVLLQQARNPKGVTVAELVRDEAGKLLYITGETSKNIGLPAGGSMMHRSLIRSDIMDELENSNTAVASAEALAYTTVDLDD